MGVAISAVKAPFGLTFRSMLLVVAVLCSVASASAAEGEVDDRLRALELVAQNQFLELYFLEETAEIAVRDSSTGAVWFSNPHGRSSEERIARGNAKDRLSAQFSLGYYTPRDELKNMDSYNDSVKYQQYEMTEIDAGIRVQYVLGREWADDAYLPVMISEGSFNELILDRVPETDRKLFLSSFDRVLMVEVSDANPAVEVYNLHSSVLGGYTLTSPGEELSARAAKTLAESFVDQIVGHRADLGSRKDLKAGDIPVAVKEHPVYVLKTRVRAWDVEDMVELIKGMGVSPEDLQRDYELYGIDPVKPNPVIFHVTLEYTLDGDSLVVRVPADELRYPVDIEGEFGGSVSYQLHMIRLLEYFGAAGVDASGYILVPDGAGGLIHLNNGKTHMPAYSSWVYGLDQALDPPPTQKTSTQRVYVPVFGLKQGNDAVVAIIEGGRAAARIFADVAGRNDSYNKVSAAFMIIPKGITSLESWVEWRQGVKGSRQSVNVYQPRAFKEDMVVRYSFLHGEDASYSGMARAYRSYLVDTGKLSKTTDRDDELPLVLELVGAISVHRPVLGAPRQVARALTTFDQAREVVDRFLSSGVSEIALRYTGWMEGGIYHAFPDSVRVEKAVGGQSGFNRLSDYLVDNGIELYPDVAFLNVYQNRLLDGFWTIRDAARYLNKEPARSLEYHMISSELQTSSASLVLSARRLPSVVDGFVQTYGKYDAGGLSLRDLGQQVNSDFREDANDLVDREQAVDITVEQMRMLVEEHRLKLMVDGGNDYSLPYASYVVGLPMDSSGYNILDESVPFYQMVVHGYLDYAGSPLNHAQDQVWEKLRTIESGAIPYYQLTYADSSEVKRTQANGLYSMSYEDWIDDAVEFYKEASEILGPVREQRIVDHSELVPGLFQTVYESGQSVLVNYTDAVVTVDGITVPAKGYRLVEEALTSE